MTVDEFKAEGLDRCRTERVPTHHPDGSVGEPYIGILIAPVSGHIKLKTRLARWDRWLDRRWERRHPHSAREAAE
jgi:hypothetical protein